MGISVTNDSPIYFLERVVTMIEFDELGCMNLIGVFLSIVAFGIVFPFDEVLKGFRLSIASMTLDLVHFIFFFTINQVRWRLGEVWAVQGCFAIGR